MEQEEGAEVGEAVQGLVSPTWLAERLHDPNVVVLDCRRFPGDAAERRAAYEAEHIPGARYIDPATDMSGPPGQRGRNPLPDLDELAARLGQAGIDRSTTVICYDNAHGSLAGRMWWLLRYMGVRSAGVLDGGWNGWKAAGLPVTSEVPRPEPRTFVPDIQSHMLVSMDEVREMSREGRGVLVDVRSAERFRGEMETLDPVAGHIPGARNYPWENNVYANGFYREADELRAMYGELAEEPDLVIYCGSGVTACSTLLALERAGIRGARLYLGGWSEWCRQPENPVATGE